MVMYSVICVLFMGASWMSMKKAVNEEIDLQKDRLQRCKIDQKEVQASYK